MYCVAFSLFVWWWQANTSLHVSVRMCLSVCLASWIWYVITYCDPEIGYVSSLASWPQTDRQTDGLTAFIYGQLAQLWVGCWSEWHDANQHFDSPDDTDRKLTIANILWSEVIMLMHICPLAKSCAETHKCVYFICMVIISFQQLTRVSSDQ